MKQFSAISWPQQVIFDETMMIYTLY